MGLRLWRWYAGIGLLVAGAYFLLDGAARDAAYLTLSLAAAAAIVAGIRLHRPAPALPWWLLALGQLLYFSADALYTYYDRTGEIPFPSFADGLYVAAYGVLILGVTMLVRGRTRGVDRGGIVDATIVGTAAAVLAWMYLMVPYTDDASMSVLAKATALAYPVLDVVLIVGAVRLAGHPGGGCARISCSFSP